MIKKWAQSKKIESFFDLTDNLIVIKKNSICVFDKPVYVGFSVLEFSKHHMYFLLYDIIKPKWQHAKLMYM